MSLGLTPPPRIPKLPEIIVSNPAWSCEVLATPAAAREIKSTSGTLRVWRTQGIGPSFFKVGHRVYYIRRDLLEWLSAGGTRRSTRAVA